MGRADVGDEYVRDHPYVGEMWPGASCQYLYRVKLGEDLICGQQAMVHTVLGDEMVKGHTYQDGAGGVCSWQPSDDISARCLLPSRVHADPGPSKPLDHDFVDVGDGYCAYTREITEESGDGTTTHTWKRYCGYPRSLHEWSDHDRRLRDKKNVGALVRKADAAQYERAPMPDAARSGPVVTLIDAPVDPLGTLAVIGGVYSGRIARSKAEVTDEQRRAMLADMQKTVLDGPLECVQFTFLIEGVSRAFTHQAVRNRFSFFAQESLRFAVAEDWAQEVPLPPSLTQGEGAAVGVWRKALNAAEDAYNALIGAGMPAEEARGVLPHAITTRYYWVVTLRTLLQEAGKRTCTQAQFDWRVVMAGVAKALREHDWASAEMGDNWQYVAFADLIRPVCYQQGKCGFMAKFDRGCTIRSRVDAFERNGIPSSEWGVRYGKERGEHSEVLRHIDPAEWAADPGAARTTDRS